MSNLLSYLKKQPLSILLIVAIWVVCMIPVPETPLDDVKFIDKWTHLCMYGTLVLVIMIEYGRRKKSPLHDTPRGEDLQKDCLLVDCCYQSVWVDLWNWRKPTSLMVCVLVTGSTSQQTRAEPS